MSTQEDHSDDAALAGEYVLHLLEDPERAAFERRLADEPALRDLVREWDAQLVRLTDGVEPVPPRHAVKAGIEKALFAEARAPRRGWIPGWLVGGLVAAVLGFGAVILTPLLIEDTAPAFTASVAAGDGSLIVAARFVSGTNTLEISREAGGALPDRVLELWLIADGAAAPVSLGVLPEGPEARIAVPPALVQQLADGVLAISDEPVGGSPTGAPTGAVLAVGPLTEV